MKWTWLLVIVLALSLGLNIGLVIRSERGGGVSGFEPPPFVGPPDEREGPHRHSEFIRHHIERLANRLDLDEERRERLRAVTDEMMPLVLERREEVQAKRSAIRDAYRRGDVDPATIRGLVGELGRAQAALDSLVAETMLREMEVLGPDQRREYFRSLPWEGRHGDRSDRGRGQRRHR